MIHDSRESLLRESFFILVNTSLRESVENSEVLPLSSMFMLWIDGLGMRFRMFKYVSLIRNGQISQDSIYLCLGHYVYVTAYGRGNIAEWERERAVWVLCACVTDKYMCYENLWMTVEDIFGNKNCVEVDLCHTISAVKTI